MSIKSRGNWQINFCLKRNCKNRGLKCTECIIIAGSPSEYKTLVDEIAETYKKEKK